MRTFGFFRGVGHSEAKIRTRDRFDLMMDHEPGKQRFVSFFFILNDPNHDLDKVIHATKEVLRFVNEHLGQFPSISIYYQCGCGFLSAKIRDRIHTPVLWVLWPTAAGWTWFNSSINSFSRHCETGRTNSEKLDRIVSDIKRDFRDGVNMILLVGMLEGRYLRAFLLVLYTTHGILRF